MQYLSLYDSYLKQLVKIHLDHTIKIYTCGPTVYYYPHIGNLASVFLGDIITKAINYQSDFIGLKAQWCVNITDIGHLTDDGDNGEDKMELGAKRSGQSPKEIADFYTADYKAQCKALNITLPEGLYNPKATDYIEQQARLALQLLAMNKAYCLEDGIYFDAVANQDIAQDFWPKNQDNQDKNFTGRLIVNTTKNSMDFALWKFVNPATIQKYQFISFDQIEKDFNNLEDWQNICNKWGCPGWHSECVAMICSVLGLNGSVKASKFSFSSFSSSTKLPVIDIHTGGEDHFDIHHKNEILQSRALGFKLSQTWVHNKFVQVDNKKMSKSVGNVYNLLGDFETTGFITLQQKGYNPLAFRFMLLEHSYQEALNFTWDKLEQSVSRYYGLLKIMAGITSFIKSKNIILEGIEANQELKTEFGSLLLDNLKTSKVLELYQAKLTDLLTVIIKNNSLTNQELKTFKTLLIFDQEVLNLNLVYIPTKNQLEQVSLRQEAKSNKDYQKSDSLRDELISQNIVVDDYNWGTALWHK
jgi:cysteinyl-tRNA synthetase